MPQFPHFVFEQIMMEQPADAPFLSLTAKLTFDFRS
jgi:hypothetical protein